MPVEPIELERYLHTRLEADGFPDMGINGLQLDGNATITSIASSATASRAMCEAAVNAGANALLVHHGWFWGGDPSIRGLLRDRVATLIKADCSLLAYHLPLDAHPEHGNNAWILRQLGAAVTGPLGSYKGAPLGLTGELAAPMRIAELVSRCATLFDHPVLHAPGGPDTISRIGAISGGGQNHLSQAAAAGCEAFITGDSTEQTWHEAAELGIHCLCCGHYATERHAIHELAAAAAAEFGLEHHRLDEANPC